MKPTYMEPRLGHGDPTETIAHISTICPYKCGPSDTIIFIFWAVGYFDYLVMKLASDLETLFQVDALSIKGIVDETTRDRNHYYSTFDLSLADGPSVVTTRVNNRHTYTPIHPKLAIMVTTMDGQMHRHIVDLGYCPPNLFSKKYEIKLKDMKLNSSIRANGIRKVCVHHIDEPSL